MIRRSAALALALGLACGTVAHGATEVRIPGLTGAKASIRLVLQADRKTQVLGFDGLEWATTYSAHDLAAAATVSLTPTADIATVGGKATCYLISVSATGGRGWTECVQVPDSPTALDLADLVGLSGIDPASFLAGRLLTTDERAALNAATSPPDADNRIVVAADIDGDVLLPPSAGAEEGWALTLDASLAPIWSAGADLGCTTLDCLEDGPSTLGTAGQVLATATGGETWEWITPPLAATQGEMEAGTEAALRQLSPLLVRQGLDARLAAPPSIGWFTPASGNFSELQSNHVRTDPLPASLFGTDFRASTSGASTGNLSSVSGGYGLATHSGSGLAGSVNGMAVQSLTTGAAKATNQHGLLVYALAQGNASGYVANLLGAALSVQPNAYTTESYGLWIGPTAGRGPTTETYGLWIGDQSGVGTTASHNIYSAGANSTNILEGSLQIAGDLVLGERADHKSTPAAGYGYLWVENTAPSTLVFTDDAGTDLTLGSSGVSADADQALSLGSDDLPWLDTASSLSADERAALDEATAAPSETNRILVGTDTLSIPVYDLGDIGDATVPVVVADDDVRKIYTAATTSAGTITITPPAAGMRVTTVYIDGDGEHETALASTADLYWHSGQAQALEACYGERIELWATCLPTRCQMAARTSSVAPVYASATTDPAGDNNAIVWTSSVAGLAGSEYSVTITDPATVSTPLTVTSVGGAITINCQQDASSNCISTAAQVIAATTALVGANATGNDGTGVVAAVSATPLTCAAP